jgi:hypothetical protein
MWVYFVELAVHYIVEGLAYFHMNRHHIHLLLDVGEERYYTDLFSTYNSLFIYIITL